MRFEGRWFALLGLSAIAARYFGVAATDVVAGLLVVVAACLIDIDVWVPIILAVSLPEILAALS